jgi:hypothetical protein
MKICKQDLDENNFYKQDEIETDESIIIEENLGIVKFRKSVKTRSYIQAGTGSSIKADWSIEAGWG